MTRKLGLILVVLLVLGIFSGVVQAQDTPVHRVGFVPPALTSPFHVAMVEGAQARADELGWELVVQAPASEGDFQAFVTTVEQLLETGIEAISINPIGTDSAITAVRAANEAGIPILAHNFITPFDDESVEVAAYIGYDQWGGAAALAAAFAQAGAFPLPDDSRDAALLVTLPPGSYTAQISGVGGTGGRAIVEVYEVP